MDLVQRFATYRLIAIYLGYVQNAVGFPRFLGQSSVLKHDQPRLKYAVRIDGILPCRWLECEDDGPHEPWSSADATALSPPNLGD